MIGMNLKPIVCALAVGSASIWGTGCDADGAIGSLVLDASPVAQYGEYTSGSGAVARAGPATGSAEASGSARAGTAATGTAEAEAPTHAEVRHYAVYSRYRDLFGSSGGGASENANSCGVAEDGSDNFLLWGSRLLGSEYLFCSGAGREK